jgi:hypothetical protein
MSATGHLSKRWLGPSRADHTYSRSYGAALSFDVELVPFIALGVL